MRSLVLLIFLVINLTPHFASQSYSPVRKDPIIQSQFWTEFHEMENYEFNCMAEDHTGRIWFGGRGIIVSYDKEGWSYYPLSEEILDNRVLSICPTLRGIIYAGSESGLYKYDYGVWHRIIPIEKTSKIRINQVKRFSDGSIWLASNKGLFSIQNGHIFLYTTKTTASELINDFPKITIQLFHDESIEELNVVSICEGRSNEIWFWLESGKIIQSNYSNPINDIKIWQLIEKDKGIEPEMPRRLLLADDGKIWAVASQANVGVNIYDPKTNRWKIVYLSTMFSGDDIHESIIQTRDGKIWIGGISRIHTYYNNEWKQYTNHVTSLPEARIELLEAKDGSVWIGGKHNEIYRLDYAQQRYEIFSGLNYFGETLDGNRWFITSSGCVACQFKNQEWISYGIEDGLIDAPLVMLVSSNDRVWTAGSHESVSSTAYFNGEKWIKQTYPEMGMSVHFQNFFQAADGSLWISSFDTIMKDQFHGGVIRIKMDESGNIIKTHFTADDIGKSDVIGITQTPDGNIWTAGVFVGKYDGIEWQHVINPPEFATGWLDDIEYVSHCGLWAAKEGVGLFYLPDSSEEWIKFTVADGLANNTILDILPLKDYSVLAGTRKGISRFDGRSWTQYAFPKAIHLERGSGSLYQSADSSIWINASARSWTLRAMNPITDREKEYIRNNFHTIRYIPEKIPPKTNILLAPQNVSDDGNIFIRWEGTDYLHETPKEMIQYSYRLDNQAWSPYTTETQKQFFSLDKGAHVFEIRARDGDRNVEIQTQRHIFIVSPPLWMRPWFVTLVIMFVGIIIFLIYYSYNKQVHINKMEAAKVHEMTMMKLRFYTNLSHDLRTPLNLILGPLTDLLDKMRPGSDNQLKQQYELMYRNANRLNVLVNEIIDIRKIEAGNMEYSPSSGSITNFIENVADSFKMLAVKQDIKFILTINFEDCYVLFDFEKLETILYNLLSNAFKFTPPRGEINLILKFKSYDNEKILEIAVEDSGPGIPEKNIKDIFDRYIQLETSNYGNEKGAGIGLALTKELVEICDGEISASNRIDGGAVFTVRLPLKIDNQSLISEREKFVFDDILMQDIEEEDHIDKKDSEKPVILVVEDYDDEREYLVGKLLEHYDVISARDGKEGIKKAITMIPDLIISDIKMPKLDGFEFCKYVREDTVTSHIPFIFLTGSGSEEATLEGLRTGADDYMTKPFKFSLLLARIQALFESRKKFYERFNESFQFDASDLTSKDDEFFKKVRDVVMNYLADEDFDVLKLCAEIGMSRTQLFRKFKSLTGSTPNVYIRQIRLQKAAHLLKHTQMNVTEICYEVGYKYPGHFSQHFKKQYGLSPKDYQRK